MSGRDRPWVTEPREGAVVVDVLPMSTLRDLRNLGPVLTLVLACCGPDGGGTDGTTTDATTGGAPTTESQPTTGITSETTSEAMSEATTSEATTSEATTGEPTTTGTTSIGSTGSVGDSCECEEGEPCAAVLCEPAIWVEEGGAPADEAQLAANVQCALEALRDRKPGSLRWGFQSGDGTTDSYEVYQMFGDGQARYLRGGDVGDCEWLEEDVAVVELRAASVYADCLAAAELMERFACIPATEEMYTVVCFEAELECEL